MADSQCACVYECFIISCLYLFSVCLYVFTFIVESFGLSVLSYVKKKNVYQGKKLFVWSSWSIDYVSTISSAQIMIVCYLIFLFTFYQLLFASNSITNYSTLSFLELKSNDFYTHTMTQLWESMLFITYKTFKMNTVTHDKDQYNSYNNDCFRFTHRDQCHETKDKCYYVNNDVTNIVIIIFCCRQEMIIQIVYKLNKTVYEMYKGQMNKFLNCCQNKRKYILLIFAIFLLIYRHAKYVCKVHLDLQINTCFFLSNLDAMLIFDENSIPSHCQLMYILCEIYVLLWLNTENVCIYVSLTWICLPLSFLQLLPVFTPLYELLI